ncbi:hypothetical protein chiPu_0001561 [Chiloscyllium punctatum]|uniref:PARP catalytic domain-containing protein n=1 Tax=Chiloscyllium punctatum TaxID=137246 RepID=A0A401RYJ4_CHIPU|nr:hypothetical protein [Chiloscyllium punctatum]
MLIGAPHFSLQFRNSLQTPGLLSVKKLREPKVNEFELSQDLVSISGSGNCQEKWSWSWRSYKIATEEGELHSEKMSIEFYGWQVIHEDNSHLKSGQELKNGRGYTMYHGTHKNNAASIIKSGFIPSKDGLLGAGVYVSRDVTKAKAYPKLTAASDKVVFKLKVRAGKVKKIDVDNHPLQKTWHQHGYDSAWVPPNCRMLSIPSGKEEDCIWDPKQITVVDIAYADDQVKKDLKKLIHKNTAAKTRGLCDVCGCQRDSSHVIHRCWGCEKVICSFMSKHVCKKTK